MPMPNPNPRQYLTISQQNNTIMLPRRIAITAQNNNSNVARLNAAFVADNSIIETVNPAELEKLKQYKIEEEKLQQLVDDKDKHKDKYDGTKSISASGNIEAETNKLELVDNDEFDKYKSGDDSSASASTSASSNTIVRKDRLTMEYNEETEEQKNLNESSVVKNWNGYTTIGEYEQNEDEDVQKKYHHDFEVTTMSLPPLNSSIATAEDYIDENEKITTTEEDFDHNQEVEVLGAHLNLAINRDREDAESSADEFEAVEMSEAFNKEWEEDLAVQENLANTDDNSNVEIHVPADLSNDIIVNDYAALHNVPYNPDAEFIDVTSTTLKNSSMPILENLSMK